MADLITKGMPDWQTPINNFAAKNAIVISPWSTAGIVYQNGFSQFHDVANTLQYRTLDQGIQRTVQFAGWTTSPAMAARAATVFATVPISLFKGHTGFIQQYERFACFWADQWVSVGINPATGEFKITNEASRDTGAVTASALQINYSVTW